MPLSIMVDGKDDTVTPLYESYLHIYDGVGHLFTPSDQPDDQYPNPDKTIQKEAYEEIDLFLKKLGYID